jgi:hypothetical protein
MSGHKRFVRNLTHLGLGEFLAGDMAGVENGAYKYLYTYKQLTR